MKNRKSPLISVAIVSIIFAMTVTYTMFVLSKNTKNLESKRLVNHWPYPPILVKEVHCAAIINGNTEEANKASSFQPPSEYWKDSKVFLGAQYDCPAFVTQRSYITNHVSVEERDFPIAFSLVVYKDIIQVERLLRAIYRPHNYYCIHVDRKSSKTFQDSIASIATCFPNVIVTHESANVVWGEMGVVEAELLCMKELIKYKWKYLINLTGQEFPLKTNLELVDILKGYDGRNDITGTIKRRNIQRTLSREPAPHDIVLLKGQVHIAAVRGFVQFLLTDKRVAEFLKWLNGTFVPDETFFSSINGNSHLNAPGSFQGSLEDIEPVPSIVRYKLWYPNLCYGQWQRAICVFGYVIYSLWLLLHKCLPTNSKHISSIWDTAV